jgi:hypothetical protein
MKMAYIAINPVTMDCYAISSADPAFIADAAEEIEQWKKDGAIIELLPQDEALNRFTDGLSIEKTEKQMKLFSDHLDGK